MTFKASSDVYPVVLVHGLWGNVCHLAAAREDLLKVFDKNVENATMRSKGSKLAEVRVLIARGNEGTHTYDGIDVCGARVADEIQREIQIIQADSSRIVSHYSIMGYSVGGLIARYVIALLHHRDSSFFVEHQPATFATFATPHVGVLKSRGRFWQWVAVKVGHRLLGRTGDQLYGWDRYSSLDERPLLEVMSDPEEIFIQILNRFRRIDFFTNAINDHTVPYPTGAINYDDPFAQMATYSSDVEEVVVETDEDLIVQRWYTVPVCRIKPSDDRGLYRACAHASTQSVPNFDAQKTSKDATRALLTEHRLRLDAKRKRPPFLPPFLLFPHPFDYVFYASMPIFMPIFMLGVIVVFIFASEKSRRRAKAILFNQSQPTQKIESWTEDQKRYTPSEETFSTHPAHDAADPTGYIGTRRRRDTRLELTDVQRRIIRHLNEGVD